MNTVGQAMPLLPQASKRDYTIILDDLEFVFRKEQLEEIKDMHNDGMWVTDIARRIRRNEYEVLLAIVHLHIKNKLTRELAFREK